MKFPTLLTAQRLSELARCEAAPSVSESSSYSIPDADVWPVPPHLIENEAAIEVPVYLLH